MKLGLNEKVTKIIDGYKANCTDQENAIVQILEPYKIPSYASRFTKEGLQADIKEKVDKVLKDWKKYDIVVNQEIKTVLESAKSDVMEGLGLKESKAKPADYATKISNAIQFVQVALSSIEPGHILDAREAEELDSDLHSILKDFIEDYDTMKQFKKMIEREVPTINGYDGKTIFPKTFGQFAKVEAVMNTIDELQAASQNVFIFKRSTGREVIRINGVGFSVPMDGYAESVAEQNLADYSTILDDLADDIA